jgi:glycine cleavage system H protein
MLPQDLKYTKSHEYIRLEGDVATIGITDHAAEQLGDVVYVELPEVGRELKEGESFGVVESVKAVSDLYSPVAGVVTEVNEALNDEPSLVNDDAYGQGWMIKVKPSAPASDVLSPEQYRLLIGA